MKGRPTVALINREAIKYNYAQIKEKLSPTTRVMAVVKANAYGHGDTIVADTLEKAGCRLFGVATVDEAVRLREAGIKADIVVLGGIYPPDIDDLIEFNLTPVIFDIDTALLLNKRAERRGVKKGVHIKIDSGMGRLGLFVDQVVSFFREFKNLTHLTVDGILSQFSEMDDPERSYSKKQLATFLKAVGIVQGMGYTPSYIHMANSAAIVDFVESHFNLVRPGIMLYGVYPTMRLKDKIALRPVMELKSQVLQVKKVPPGFPVSYGRSFVTTRESLIATIPIGYGDGLPYGLSGKGEVLIRGKRVPIIGKVCMDLTMVDVTMVEGVEPGTEVVLMGSQEGETITAEEIAQKAGTIPYEILCNISHRVPRLPV